MKTKRNIVIFVIAIVLIVVVIGLPSMKFVQRLSAGCPLDQNKAVLTCNPCMYHTVASQIENGDVVTTAPPSTPVDIQLSISLSAETVNPVAISVFNPSLEKPPLRC